MRKNDNPTVIDEEGRPVVDAGTSREGDRLHEGFAPFGGIPPIPEGVVGKNGKISLLKLIGWKGVAALVLVVAVLVTLAVATTALALLALPALLVIGAIGYLASKLRRVGGPNRSTAPVRR